MHVDIAKLAIVNQPDHLGVAITAQGEIAIRAIHQGQTVTISLDLSQAKNLGVDVIAAAAVAHHLMSAQAPPPPPVPRIGQNGRH